MPPEKEDHIKGKIYLHDRQQFELKLNFNLDPNKLTNSYTIDYYYFIPKQLGINKDTYSKSKFYEDIQSHIRLKTPEILLKEILDKKNQKSPFVRIEKWFGGEFDDESIENIIYELKILACIFKSDLRDEIAEIESRPTNKGLNSLIKDIDDVQNEIVRLKGKMPRDAPQRLKEAFRFIEEYTSIVVEKRFISLLPDLKKDKKLTATIKKKLKNEYDYRKKENFSSLIDIKHGDENFFYRKGILKKYISNVLYLDTKSARTKSAFNNFLAFIAASIAMFAALLLTFYAQNKYATKSLPFIILAMAAYAMKDRIKIWMTDLFHKYMVWIPDSVLNIIDPYSGKKIGLMREAVTFLNLSRVPEDVKELRRIDGKYTIEEEGKPENIIKYQKRVTLSPSVIRSVHNRSNNLNAIIRFSLHNFLHMTADPIIKKKFYEPKSSKIEDIDLSKVYHLNLILRFRYGSGKHKDEFMKRVRVVLDRNGIKRLEDLCPAKREVCTVITENMLDDEDEEAYAF